MRFINMKEYNENKNVRKCQETKKEERFRYKSTGGVKRYKEKFFYKFQRFMLGWFFRWYFNPQIFGEDNIPLQKDAPVIIAGNHISVLDPCTCVVSTKRCIHFLVKKECFDNIFLSWFFKGIGSISVDRADNPRKAIEEAIRILKLNGTIGIYPEGKRNKERDKKDLLPFKNGAIFFAQETNSLIVPVAVTGNYKFRSKDLKVRFGKSFSVEGMNKVEARKLLEEKIRELMNENLGIKSVPQEISEVSNLDGKILNDKVYHVLYNPLSRNHHGENEAHKLTNLIKDANLIYEDITKLTDYKKYFDDVKEDIILCGGDGTLNKFINNTEGINYTNNILYFPAGSGNDFHNDIGKDKQVPYRINEYLKDLPIVTVYGEKYRFLNGIGYGIDGYCCEEGEKSKTNSDKPVNYTSIAIKGLLYDYKRANATVNLDGEEKTFKKVWLAPTMKGRYYGGGVMVAPRQDRIDSHKRVTFVTLYNTPKLKTLINFSTIFEGTQEKKFKNIYTQKCRHVKVTFDRPTALQIDGETIVGVTEYEVDIEK